MSKDGAFIFGLIGGMLLGLAVGVFIGSIKQYEHTQRFAVENGHGHYNTTTGAFEWGASK